MWTFRIRFELNAGDLWIGTAWKRDRELGELDVRICLLPCVPVRLAWRWSCRDCGIPIVRRRRFCAACELGRLVS